LANDTSISLWTLAREQIVTLVYALSFVLTRIRFTRVRIWNDLFTACSSEPLHTCTHKFSGVVGFTTPVIFARVTGTGVQIYFACFSLKSFHTLAGEVAVFFWDTKTTVVARGRLARVADVACDTPEAIGALTAKISFRERETFRTLQTRIWLTRISIFVDLAHLPRESRHAVTQEVSPHALASATVQTRIGVASTYHQIAVCGFVAAWTVAHVLSTV